MSKHDWQEMPPDDGCDYARICRACRVSQQLVPYERMRAGFHRWNGKRWEMVTSYDPSARYFGHKMGKKWSPPVVRCAVGPSESD